MRLARPLSALLAVSTLALGCPAHIREFKRGEEIRSIALDRAIISAEGRLVMDGQDYGPYGSSDLARMEKDRDGRIHVFVNGEERHPTGVPIPKSLQPG